MPWLNVSGAAGESRAAGWHQRSSATAPAVLEGWQTSALSQSVRFRVVFVCSSKTLGARGWLRRDFFFLGGGEANKNEGEGH